METKAIINSNNILKLDVAHCKMYIQDTKIVDKDVVVKSNEYNFITWYVLV